MNHLLDDDDARMHGKERELTLSTGAILGIFLGLVVLCAACFGVGYNMGRKSAPTPLALNDSTSTSAGSDTLADSGLSAKTSVTTPGDNSDDAAPAVVTPPPPARKPAPIERKPPTPRPEPATDAIATPPPAPVTRTPPPTPSSAARAVSPAALMPGAGTGTIMVQIAAVSHKDDADLLVGALKARGYTVSARPSASDGFIHVQVGPFSSKKDAEAMRQRLIADGYNAILK